MCILYLAMIKDINKLCTPHDNQWKPKLKWLSIYCYMVYERYQLVYMFVLECSLFKLNKHHIIH